MPDDVNPLNLKSDIDNNSEVNISPNSDVATVSSQSEPTAATDPTIPMQTVSPADPAIPATQNDFASQPSQTPPSTQKIQDDVVLPATSASQADTSTVTSHTPQKYGGKKVIATIFGILLLIGGVATGVFLVQRQQALEQEAASGKECSQSPDCILLDNEKNQGSFTAPRPITHAFITDKDVHRYDPGDTDDGCRKVSIRDNYISWDKYGSGPDCKDVSNVQIWLGQPQPSVTPTQQPSPTPTQPPGQTPTPTKKISPTVTPQNTATPTPTTHPDMTAQCFDVVAYDTQWNTLSSSDLASLKTGDKVRFAVTGTTSSGSFDKARFTINGTLSPEVTAKKPGTDEYYYEYTIPGGTATFTVKGELHHSDLGWI